ncbi:TraR/DksA C4-type zinc finger protein [Enterobacteriaceae bacterium H11S18]|uniref:TraR/DksA C4-type zinc finger protein n=1 Tax=Dryocola clanedunensis TaxID=2925396 RepID=UPI0022F111D6|nr:TraR/DksA C4-type zinc finger protein [Dryocola clanedunensis]MCT4709153.1 TraR/DksA C4-type zinc finger protein [Dryocola clanedunensis]
MCDLADQAQKTIEDMETLHVAGVRMTLQVEGGDECEDCGQALSAARRQAAPWATTCVTCQSIREHKKKVGCL